MGVRGGYQGISTTNYLQYYDVENYLFNIVGPLFHEQGILSAFDFFCIVIWKANRSKSLIARRLLAYSTSGDLNEVVRELTSSVNNQATAKDRMFILMNIWGFRLPMASAILTVLYPDDFTVYDYRICECLGDYFTIGSISHFGKMWSGYMAFRQAVINSAPADLTLRDKDRYLWAQSFAEQLKRDLIIGFMREDG